MTETQRLIDALNRNTEVVAIVATLRYAAECYCGRLATKSAGDCGLTIGDRTFARCDEHGPNAEDLPQAKRVRRLEALMKDEAR